MQKFILVYIQPSVTNTYDILPGTMFEVDRFDSLEDAQQGGKDFIAKNRGVDVIIMQYFSVEV